MNKFSIKFQKEVDEEGKKLFFPSLVIDNKILFDDYDVVVDLSELTESSEKEGEFFIFSCGCGFPECAGIYDGVIVSHKNNTISWKITDPFPKLNLEFNKTDYLNEIKSANKLLQSDAPNEPR